MSFFTTIRKESRIRLPIDTECSLTVLRSGAAVPTNRLTTCGDWRRPRPQAGGAGAAHTLIKLRIAERAT